MMEHKYPYYLKGTKSFTVKYLPENNTMRQEVCKNTHLPVFICVVKILFVVSRF